MGRWLSLSLLLAASAYAQDGGVPDEAKALMKEGLEREVPTPSPRSGAPTWPTPQQAEGARRRDVRAQDALLDKARLDAASRARTMAEEKRTTPEQQPATGQARTNAAKSPVTPPRPQPPRP